MREAAGSSLGALDTTELLGCVCRSQTISVLVAS
jgi:hypothetical protein